MSEEASNTSVENQEVENVDSQVNDITENLHASRLSENDSVLTDSIPGIECIYLLSFSTHIHVTNA